MVLKHYITCLHLKYYLILNLNLNKYILFIKLLHNKYYFEINIVNEYNLLKNI